MAPQLKILNGDWQLDEKFEQATKGKLTVKEFGKLFRSRINNNQNYIRMDL